MSKVISLSEPSPFYRAFSSHEKAIIEALEAAIEKSAARLGADAARLFSHGRTLEAEKKAA